MFFQHLGGGAGWGGLPLLRVHRTSSPTYAVNFIHKTAVSANGIHSQSKPQMFCDLHGGLGCADVGLHAEPVQSEGSEVKLL